MQRYLRYHVPQVQKEYYSQCCRATFQLVYIKLVQILEQETGTKVNYQAVGSGAGVRQYTANTVDFGALITSVIQKIRTWCCSNPHDWWCYCYSYNNPNVLY